MNHRNGLVLGLLLGLLLASSCGGKRGAHRSRTELGTLNSPVERYAGEPVASSGAHPKSIPELRNRLFSAGSLEILDPVPAIDTLRAWEFSYESEGFTNYGLIEQPAGEPPKNGWPVIILAHGYIPPDSYSTAESYRLVTRYYASGGFMVVKPDYRGHGRSEGGVPSAARTVDYTLDVLNLIAGLEEIPNADTDNIFLYGHSMGGEIGLRILTVNDSLKGATLWAAVTESFPENTLYFIRKRSPEEAERLQSLIDREFTPDDYPSLTPNSYLDSISVPILIHHGTEDESVPFGWTLPFRRRLDAAGVDYVFFEYPGENHNISGEFLSGDGHRHGVLSDPHGVNAAAGKSAILPTPKRSGQNLLESRRRHDLLYTLSTLKRVSADTLMLETTFSGFHPWIYTASATKSPTSEVEYPISPAARLLILVPVT